MVRLLHFCILLFAITHSFSQPKGKTETEKAPAQPKLVVGIVVDQMRWDYLYRFRDRFGEGGFKRMLKEGFTCENTMIPYAQTVTAAGHACVYTGSVPAINGIMGNQWYDRSRGRYVYCVEDDRVKPVGGNGKSDPMSPRNLFTNTIGDELRLSTNFRSKVVGVAIKDRGAILPAGHSGKAFWYESKTGSFITSTYYQPELPGWVQGFNERKVPDSLYAKDWTTLYPIETYLQSDKDNVPYEGKFQHEETPSFPHKLTGMIGTNYGTISSTPQGNTMTLEFSRAAIKGEGLGKDEITDLLAISLSSTDYVGHQFGPNSIEIEDTYLRLDADLAKFFAYLDTEVGKGKWLLFLTADHAAAHASGFLKDHSLPIGSLSTNAAALNKLIEAKYGIPNVVMANANYHFYFNFEKIDSAQKNADEIINYAIAELEKDTAVMMAMDARQLASVNLPAEIKNRYANGYNKKLAGDVILLLKPAYFWGNYKTGTTHGAWNPYDSHIPMLFMGWGVKHGHTNRPTFMTDIAPTITALLKIQMPNGSIGNPVVEITD